MTELTRRNLLAGSALAAAATTLPATTQAAAPASGKQAAAFYRYKVGSFELTAVHDGVWNRKVDNTFIRGASRPEIEKAMVNAFMPPETVPTPFTPVVVNTGSKLVMIDTATGGQLPPPSGSYMANLAAAGIDPKSIDAILISHFHPDHINGLRDKDGGLVFPNAEVHVPAPEWAFWMDDANMNKAPEAARPVWLNVRRVFKDIGDKVVKFEPGKELVPGISSMATHGHTPGHASFIVASGNQSMLVLGDVTNNPYLFLRNPDWQGVFDTDGPMAVETRKKVLDRLTVDRMLVQGYHFPFPGAGYVIKIGAHNYDLVPVVWQPSL
jgi:glyoxylase-like metal-dependent hydrolase (beta-lactamase superfamily II)